MTARAPARGRLDETAVAILQGIHQHRLLSTAQIHALHTPEASLRWTHQALRALRDTGLVHMTRLAHGHALWHVTQAGAGAVEQIPDRVETRRKVLAPDAGAAALARHTLAVNEVGIAFVQAARQRGDECGPLAWRHEIAHPLGRPPGRRRSDRLIADAVLRYQFNRPDRHPRFHYRFVELDRATRAADDLAARLARYGRLHRDTAPAGDLARPPGPAWARLYPVFPTVLLVLSGRARVALERRRDTVLALCARHPDLADSPARDIHACLLGDLTEHGPFAAIFRTPADPDRPVPWLAEDRRA